jgi:hypothetical protein
VFSLQQKKQAFRNLGNGQFEDATKAAGRAFELPEVSRGLAFGDIDNDGDLDMVVGNDNGPLRLFINNVGNRKHWVGFAFGGPERAALRTNVRVAVTTSDGRTIWRRAHTDGSYASARDPRVLVGLGDASGPVKVRVMWPDGKVDEKSGVPIDRYAKINEAR